MTRAVLSGQAARIRAEFQSGNWIPGLTSGTLIGIKEAIFALSVGSLIFSGDLAPYLAYGLGIALVTQIIVLVAISLGSSVPGVMGGLQDTSSVILAAMAAALFGASGAGGAEERLTTVLVGIAATTVLTGVALWALGFFRLGSLVRYVPYPVVGGFLAGTGWLLVVGSFSVMANGPPTFSGLRAMLQPERLALWLPGVLLALVLLITLRWVRHVLTMPAILVGAFALFYLLLLILNLSVDEAAARGLLLAPASPAQGPAAVAAMKVIWQPLMPRHLVAADWPAISGQSGAIAVVLVLSVVSLLLNASGIELAMRQDVELNRELRVAGVANIMSGLGGGAVGFHALDLSTLCCRIGARGRLPGLVAAVLLIGVALGGTPLLALAPRPILGGLLLFLGLDFLCEWVIVGWRKLSRADYAIVVLILIVIAATDFLVGVGIGLAAMLVLFVLNYSRVSVVQHALSGTEMQSNVERSPDHRRRLQELGSCIHILELRGFIFFGTANALLEQIRSRVACSVLPPLRFVVLDFRRVTGLDSSAILSFLRCRQLAETRGVTLVLTQLTAQMARQFETGGLAAGESAVRFFADLDHGLEWCEEALLEQAEVWLEETPLTLPAQLEELCLRAAQSIRLMDFLEKVEIAEAEYLVRQGDEEGDLYLIERGKVSVYRESQDGSRLRLRTLGPGTVIGELSLYLRTGRTASVIADAPTTAYRLTPMALARMQDDEPALAAAFHELIAHILAERLVSKDRSLEALLR
jgi:SulP family sulfate permease